MTKNFSPDSLFFYRAEVKRVYDGDTIFVDIDLGLYIFIKNEKIRLARIDAPELRGDEKLKGIESRDYLRSLIDGKMIYLETIKNKKGKYGRYLGEIWLETENGIENINDLMVKNGYAEYATY